MFFRWMDRDSCCSSDFTPPFPIRQPMVVAMGLFITMLVVGCDSSRVKKSPNQVTVLSAASLSESIREIAVEFEAANPGTRVRISTGPANGLAEQILAGAPADVFLSANEKWADVVVDQGLAIKKVNFLTNRLVLIVPKGNPARIKSINDLTLDRVSKVAMAGVHVPAGTYASQALEKLNLLKALSETKRFVFGSDVRITLSYVERGEADAGFVYATDAQVSNDVEVISEVDPELHDPIIYSAVLLKSAQDNETASNFLMFLLTKSGKSSFEKHGFRILGETESDLIIEPSSSQGVSK